jgi:toxin ParE1/3/4
MKKAQFTYLAQQDLQDIKEYIAQDKPKAAREYMKTLKQRCQTLAEMPTLGVCSENYCGLYKFPEGNYLIFYRPSEKGIEVIRILHGSREVLKILQH